MLKGFFTKEKRNKLGYLWRNEKISTTATVPDRSNLQCNTERVTGTQIEREIERCGNAKISGELNKNARTRSIENSVMVRAETVMLLQRANKIL